MSEYEETEGRLEEMSKRTWIIWGIKAVLTVALIAFILCVWPGYLAYDLYVSRTLSERYEASDTLIPGSIVTQYFVPQRSHMSAIEFAVIFNEENVGSETVQFILCEESGREIFSEDIALDQMDSGCYYTVDIKKSLKEGRTYYWTLVCPDAENVGLQLMYTNHLTDQAPENSLLLLNEEQYGDITQTISQYTYHVHADKIVIIGTYWMGAILVYIICMDIVSRFAEPGQAGSLNRAGRSRKSA